ncbi:methyltransf_25 domain-containing protein [Nephila pilipes]|uniref:Methyltransf_25 domain-containing protein n=1 Tax=Nephila pilipes TaxID=299642 RepID=A0A8X6MKB6_NEPPI|nr:methyltransf_25 domain-containing protein [Nephila pilipes]
MSDQKEAFRKIYELLPPQGEAAFAFLLHNGYYNALPHLAKDPKWNSYLPLNIEEYPPESHTKNYTSLHYKKMVEDLGFIVLYCKQVQNVTTFPSDEIYTNFLYSLCELPPFIPDDERKQFKKDLFTYTLKQNGRNTDGTPVDRSTTLELVIKKVC